MQATIRGAKIYFDIAGMQLAPKGSDFVERPVLFLLHGGPGGDHLRYKQYSLELQDVAQLVFIDHRGCGRSKKTKSSDYTLENNIQDVEALRKHLGLERICLLGTSYGGVVAQGYALCYPQALEKLILVATSPSYRFLAEAKHYLQVHGAPQQIALAKHLWNGSFKNLRQTERFFESMQTMYSVTKPKNKPVATTVKTVWSYEALNQGFGGFLREFDFIPKLKKIVCPTLVLAGQNDWICSPLQAKTIAKHIPNAQLQIFKNCGHSISIDAHDRYIKAIKKFL